MISSWNQLSGPALLDGDHETPLDTNECWPTLSLKQGAILPAYPREDWVHEEACLKGWKAGGFLQAYGFYLEPKDED